MQDRRWITIGFLLVLSQQALQPGAGPQSGPIMQFQNVQNASGIDFVLENTPTERKHLPETMAGGVATFDYDGDGLTDIFFTNGADLPSLEKSSGKYRNRLYRNVGGMRFQDVTTAAGLAGEGYSIGAAVADFDNDGHVDLFVAGVRNNHLYRNRGDGTFEDVTKRAGIKDEPWSVGAVWFDYDNDGLLDLFVVNYLQWSPQFNRVCGNASGLRVYCHPRFFEGSSNRLYHNQGDGTFKDVSVEAGIASHVGKGMAGAVADYDGDGRPDIFVTNDKEPNFLFHNLGGGRFEEVAFEAGVALLDSGNEISAMGVDFRDYDNDARPDIVATALAGETFPIFRNRGAGHFLDVGHVSHLDAQSRSRSGWGIGLFDFDNDGWKDLFTANSHVDDRVEAFEATEYKQGNSVFLNRGDGAFEDVSGKIGIDFSEARAHRGCAFADFDNDGRVDVVVTSLGDHPELWHNTTRGDNTWLLVRLTGTRSNRDGIGAEVTLSGQHNQMSTAVGYASSSYFGVHFGTGIQKQIEYIDIKWPSGARQRLMNIPTDQVLRVKEPRS